MLKNASIKKIWNLLTGHTGDNPARDAVAKALGILPATAALLTSRGLTTPDAARRFIGKQTETLHDPFLLADMDKAVARIRQALVNREKIVVYGDYDVDGVTSVTILYSFLRIHAADVRYYIPSRVGEGYGVNLDAIRGFAADGCTLMITVDTGITATAEIAAAKELGLDTVVTDHHECRPELPDACAVVNPRRPDCPYPFKELAGCGVAFKLICALEANLRSTSLFNAVKFAANRFGELVAIGTIADVMPLVDENRIIVSYGLKLLEHPSCVGLRSLMRASGIMQQEPDGSWTLKKKITSSVVGFTIAPRINAAGRISNATFAVELFLTEDSVRADAIADELCEINRRRQAEENSIIEQADAKIAEQCAPDDYVIVLDDDHWHHGVIGIVCSRLTERYNLPSILVSFEKTNGFSGSDQQPLPTDIGKGSGRSVKGMNLVEALDACSDTLTKYGGHELAAGLSVEREKLPAFRRAINEYAAKIFAGQEPVRCVDIDIALEPAEISMRLAAELYMLEPYGVANAQPIFETDRLTITDVTSLAGGKHTKLTVRSGNVQLTALCFGMPSEGFGYRAGDVVDLAYNLDINEYRGRQTVQLLVRDIRASESVGAAVPDREEFARLYLHLKRRPAASPARLSELSAAAGVDDATADVMLDIFAELGLITLNRVPDLRIALSPVKNKISFDDSRIYTSLKQQHK
ncbi:MAG: single-stranded-DNA-specific exonuclease RecJ [Clostridia bacterium]|nr:single-stranded-DNA-specific exonuclease RecJ [Clostridia bacterium]